MTELKASTTEFGTPMTEFGTPMTEFGPKIRGVFSKQCTFFNFSGSACPGAGW
jgi:hypothetical protein